MSKIANRILLIPENISVEQEASYFKIVGPKGSLRQQIPAVVKITIEENKIITKLSDNAEPKDEMIVGTINSLLSNMIKGSTTGYQKVLDVKGVGYKVSLNNQTLDFSLGYSHNILLPIPSTLEIDCINSTRLVVKGANKQEVGWFAAKIRSLRKPNVFVRSYKGIFYGDEKIKIKSGKKEGKK